jgi:hypothetical protein
MIAFQIFAGINGQSQKNPIKFQSTSHKTHITLITSGKSHLKSRSITIFIASICYLLYATLPRKSLEPAVFFRSQRHSPPSPPAARLVRLSVGCYSWHPPRWRPLCGLRFAMNMGSKTTETLDSDLLRKQ